MQKKALYASDMHCGVRYENTFPALAIALLGKLFSSIMPNAYQMHLGTLSIPDSQVALAATNSMSPDGRVVQYRVWGSTLVTASDGTKQVKLGILSQDFEEILHVIGSKSDRAQMFAKSLADFLEE
eukprot:13259304-Ditylum_brightwellii.AAC.1